MAVIVIMGVSTAEAVIWSSPVILPSPPNNYAAAFGIDSDAEASLSGDGLTMYWHQFDTKGGSNFYDQDIVYTTRASVNDPWGASSEVPGINWTSQQSGQDETAPSISYDGLELYFCTNSDIYVSTRPDTSSAFGTPVPLTFDTSFIPGDYSEYTPEISRDGQHLYFSSNKQVLNLQFPEYQGDIWNIGKNLFVATRGNSASDWGNVTGLGDGVAYWKDWANPTGGDELSPCVSDDELLLLFAANRLDGGYSGIFMATRENTSELFGNRTLVTELNTDSAYNEGPEFGFGWNKDDVLAGLAGVYLNKSNVGGPWYTEDIYHADGVPEPATVGLLILGFSFLLRRRA